MGNIYCTSCGTKNNLGAKFCFNCGNQIGASALHSNQQQIKKPLVRSSEYDEDGLPTTFVKPNRLSYEIEKSKSKYSVSEIISVPPSSERMNYNLNSDFKIPSREEYLKQSLSECRPSRNPKDIDETQQ
jgi:hypothetical protein